LVCERRQGARGPGLLRLILPQGGAAPVEQLLGKGIGGTAEAVDHGGHGGVGQRLTDAEVTAGNDAARAGINQLGIQLDDGTDTVAPV